MYCSLKIDHIHKDLHQKTDEIKKGCERDILLVKTQIEAVEKKVYMLLALLLPSFLWVTLPHRRFWSPCYQQKAVLE